MLKEITKIDTLYNRNDISFEVIKVLKNFTLFDDITEATIIESIELENTLREPVESKFEIIIMNEDWESLVVVEDLINIIEKIMEETGRITMKGWKKQ